ncbi:MAG: hypothetical protein MUF46_02200 [Desulfobacterales bacterium]|jgi:preprotein translocase subunit Sss1|nr:hypothetical protein [Desulfobacterales bacterium]
MQGWLQGGQVKALARMTDTEVLQGCITGRLTPHDDQGRPITPADLMARHVGELEQELSRLDEAAWDLIGAERERMIVHQIEPLQDRLQSCKAYLQTIKSPKWDEFELPQDRAIEGCFTGCLINARYRAEEVDRLLHPESEAVQAPEEKPLADESKSARAFAQACNEKCREIAKRIWERQPDFTIAAMIRHSEIARCARKPDGNPYSDMTIRNWIRDLCPAPKPGRRPATL